VTTPNVTPAQVGALVTAIGGQAVAFGLLSGTREQTIVAITTAAIGVAWKLADAIIRNGRSRSLHGAEAAAITEEGRLDAAGAPAATSAAPSGTP
jgi:hypothetical protein